MANEIIKERMLRELRKNADNYWRWRGFYYGQVVKEMYLTDPEGCVPADYIGDDLNQEIHNKFYAILEVIREELEMRPEERWPGIIIDVSVYDSTMYQIYQGMKILFEGADKAWNFWWQTEEELMEWMYAALIEAQAAIGSRTWASWTLSEEDIQEEADAQGLSLEGRDLDEIARKFQDGISAMLSNGGYDWTDVLGEAINSTKPEVK